MREYNIIVINPGSTSDEIGYYEGENEIFHEVMRYDAKQLEPYEGKSITEQFDFRKIFLLKELKKHGVDPKKVDAIIARGGF